MIMKRDMLSNHCSSSCTLCTLKWSDNLRIFQTTQIHGASNFLTAHLRFDCIHLLRKFHGISHVAIKTIRFRRRFWCETFLWHWNCNSLWLNTLLDGFFGWFFTKHHIVASLRFQKLIHTRLNQIFLWLIMFHKCWRTNEFYSFCLFHCHKFGFRVVIDSKI